MCIMTNSSLSAPLPLAGRAEPLFADDAIARLHRVANGLPRQLNNAAIAALIAAATAGKDLVDDTAAKRRPPNSPETDITDQRGQTLTTHRYQSITKERGRQQRECLRISDRL